MKTDKFVRKKTKEQKKDKETRQIKRQLEEIFDKMKKENSLKVPNLYMERCLSVEKISKNTKNSLIQSKNNKLKKKRALSTGRNATTTPFGTPLMVRVSSSDSY